MKIYVMMLLKILIIKFKHHEHIDLKVDHYVLYIYISILFDMNKMLLKMVCIYVVKNTFNKVINTTKLIDL